jgi:hypothetical protein
MFALIGCQEPTDPPTVSPPPTSGHFDAATAGTVSGRVTWVGPLPQVPVYNIAALDPAVGPPHGALQRDNPNAPTVSPEHRGVSHAVVFLRGIDPAQARPWDHSPVRVEQADFRFRILQQETCPSIGFVRRGDSITMLSRQPELHALHADGAAFFTLSFPKPDQPQSRRLDHNGPVELRSAATYWWMRAYLFVDDHPYYTTTDEEGRFALRDVPPGNFEVVCWLPNWHERKRDLDPETCIVLRLYYHAPVTKAEPIRLKPGGKAAIDFTFAEGDFAR